VGKVVGIDLGTTNSLVAYVKDGAPVVIRDKSGDALVPSVVSAAEDGTIWLAESRMLLLHAAALAGLRKELIHSVGQEHARRILTRMGYASGARDAELAKKIRGTQNVIDAFVVGPQLHARRFGQGFPGAPRHGCRDRPLLR